MALRDQLLTDKVLPPSEVQQAEDQARAESVSLETVLRKKRILTDQQLLGLRAMREGVPYCNLMDYIPKLQNAELLSEELVRRHVIFPLFNLDGIVTLVMEDPSDLNVIDHVRRQTQLQVEVCLGGHSDIQALIERAYGASKYLQQSTIADSLLDSRSTGGDSDDSQPVIRLVDDLISEAIRQGASDIHIEPGERELRIRIRVDGVLREIVAPPLGMHRAIVSRLKVIAHLDISQTRAPQDGAIQFRDANGASIIRVSILPSVYGEVVVLRILRNESEAITLEDLGMGPVMLQRFQAIVTNPYGMILASGPTGSGKSTTLYAAMKVVVSPHKNIIAIEDPVEYRTSLIRQIQVNPEANLTFASGLRSVLRQDPDVVMVGEIRDSETAQIAVQASLTGHLVLSTVHTNDSIAAVARLRDLGVAEYLISSSLLGVLAQRLCRRICPDCQVADTPPSYHLAALGWDPQTLDFVPQRGKGCRRCVGSGYVGRVGVFELFEVNSRFAEMIAQRESPEKIRIAAQSEGMPLLVDDGIEKIRQGVTTVEEVVRVVGRRHN